MQCKNCEWGDALRLALCTRLRPAPPLQRLCITGDSKSMGATVRVPVTSPGEPGGLYTRTVALAQMLQALSSLTDLRELELTLPVDYWVAERQEDMDDVIVSLLIEDKQRAMYDALQPVATRLRKLTLLRVDHFALPDLARLLRACSQLKSLRLRMQGRWSEEKWLWPDAEHGRPMGLLAFDKFQAFALDGLAALPCLQQLRIEQLHYGQMHVAGWLPSLTGLTDLSFEVWHGCNCPRRDGACVVPAHARKLASSLPSCERLHRLCINLCSCSAKPPRMLSGPINALRWLRDLDVGDVDGHGFVILLNELARNQLTSLAARVVLGVEGGGCRGFSEQWEEATLELVQFLPPALYDDKQQAARQLREWGEKQQAERKLRELARLIGIALTPEVESALSPIVFAVARFTGLRCLAMNLATAGTPAYLARYKPAAAAHAKALYGQTWVAGTEHRCDVSLLAPWRALTQLTRLELKTCFRFFGGSVLPALLNGSGRSGESGGLNRYQRLIRLFNACMDLPTDIASLAATNGLSASFACLRELHLGWVPFTGDDCGLLAAACPQLERLHVTDGFHKHLLASGPLPPDVSALAQLRLLTHLTLVRCWVDGGAAEVLMANAWERQPRLRRLEVWEKPGSGAAVWWWANGSARWRGTAYSGVTHAVRGGVWEDMMHFPSHLRPLDSVVWCPVPKWQRSFRYKRLALRERGPCALRRLMDGVPQLMSESSFSGRGPPFTIGTRHPLPWDKEDDDRYTRDSDDRKTWESHSWLTGSSVRGSRG